jgi:hypothetical protein
MNKRSAIIVALGLVAALVVGAAGVTMGMTGPAASLASTPDPAPKVRTIHRTVTVHRQATAPAATVLGTVPAASVSAGTQGEDDGYEDDGYEDDGYEDDGYEDDGYEDDGSGEGHGGSGHDGDHEDEDD